MTTRTRRALLLWACLLALLLAGVIGVGTASAAALAPHSGGCGETQWWNTAYGISYDADTAAPALNSTYGEAFSLSGQWAPDIAAALMTCGTSKVALLYFGLGDAPGFYVSTTVDNQTGLFGLPVLPGELAKQELKGFVRLSAKMTHLGSDIGHLQPIHQGKNAPIEGG